MHSHINKIINLIVQAVTIQYRIDIYTERVSKIGNLTKRRPELKPGVPVLKRVQPLGWAREADLNSVAGDVVKNQFLNHVRYI